MEENLKVKEVLHGGKRYIVCVNEDQAKKDAHDRQAIVAALEERLTKGTKASSGIKAIGSTSGWRGMQ